MGEKKGSRTPPPHRGQGKKEDNVLVGKQIPDGDMRVVEGRTRVFILLTACVISNVLLLCLVLYGIYAEETALLRDLVKPVAAAGVIAVLWAAGARGVRALRQLLDERVEENEGSRETEGEKTENRP